MGEIMRKAFPILAFGILLAVFPSAAQELVSQREYEDLSACHGKLTGAQEVGRRLLVLFEGSENYGRIAEALRIGDDISNSMSTNLRFFENRDTNLNRPAGQSAYSTAYAPWGSLGSRSTDDQWDYWLANSAIGAMCRDLQTSLTETRLNLEAVQNFEPLPFFP